MAIVSEDVIESWSKEVGLNWLKGVPSHKQSRVHNNLQSEDLILKLKVWNITYILTYNLKFAF